MRSLRAYATDVLLVLLACAQQAELWLARRPDASVEMAVMTAMTTLPLLARRRTPLLAILVTFAGHSAVIALVPNGLQSTFFAFLAAGAIAGALPGPAAPIGLGSAGLVIAQSAWLDPNGGGFWDFGLSMAVIGAFWSGGFLLARRTRTARELAERAEATEREAVAAERARITRELHDVVAHGMTVVVVQVAAARLAVGGQAPADEVLPRLAAAEDSARQSLGDLRRMLGMLRTEVATDVTVPARGRPGIDELVARVSAAGTPVTLTVTGDPGPVPPGHDLAVYRIVQESLTNAVKHAAGAAVRVCVGYEPDQVSVAIANTAGAAGGSSPVGGVGHGLIGMRERVALYGGRLLAAPTADGGFSVSATLPLTEVRA